MNRQSRINTFNTIYKLLVIVLELVALEIGGVGIVDANAKDHHVGFCNFKVLFVGACI